MAKFLQWFEHRQCIDDPVTDEAELLHEIVHILREIRDKMSAPTDPQTVINQAAASLETAGNALVSVGEALPALLASGGTAPAPVDTSALVTQVTNVINATNAIVALLPAGTVPSS